MDEHHYFKLYTYEERLVQTLQPAQVVRAITTEARLKSGHSGLYKGGSPWQPGSGSLGTPSSTTHQLKVRTLWVTVNLWLSVWSKSGSGIGHSWAKTIAWKKVQVITTGIVWRVSWEVLLKGPGVGLWVPGVYTLHTLDQEISRKACPWRQVRKALLLFPRHHLLKKASRNIVSNQVAMLQW